MSDIDQEAFIFGLSGEIGSLSLAEPLWSGFDERKFGLLIEQQVVSGIYGKIFEYLSQLGQFLPPKEVLVELIDKAIDAAIVALAKTNPFIARVLGSPIVRDRLRAAILSGLNSLFPVIEV